MVEKYIIFNFAEKAGFPLLTDNSNKDVVISSGSDIDATEKITKFATTLEKYLTEKITKDIYKKAVKVCLENAVGEDTAYKAALQLDKLSRGEVKKEPIKRSIKIPTFDPQQFYTYTLQAGDWGIADDVMPTNTITGTTG